MSSLSSLSWLSLPRLSLPVRRRVLSAGAVVLLVLPFGALPVLADDSAPGAPDVTITIRSGLSDRDVRVSVGEVVRFVNGDGERHRIRSRSGSDGFDTGNLEPGESFQVRLSAAGTYAFVDERDRDYAAYHGRIVAGSVDAVGPTPADPGAGGVAGGGGGAAAATATATVTIGDGLFQPASTTVAVGGTVTFRNVDGDEHTATSTGGGNIDSGTLASGASYRATFAAAGTFEFLCLFHSDMRGSIRVVAPGGSGSTVPAAPVPAATPAATPQATPTSEATAAAIDATPATGRDQGSLVGIVIAATLVSVAVALFARVVGGTVRSVE